MTNAADKSKPASRSQFIERLHDLLEHPQDSEALNWTTGGTSFKVTSNETKALAALAPNCGFRSFSSFIRQLSYYDFKRLSDQRRSSEWGTSTTGFIVFTHPSGLFVRGDPPLIGITRKARNRPEKTREKSTVPNGSGDEVAMGDWSEASVHPCQSQAGPSSSLGSQPYAHTSYVGQQPQYLLQTLSPAQNEHGGQSGSLNSPQWHPPPPPPPAGLQERCRYGFAPAHYLGSYDSQNHALRSSSLSNFQIAVSPRERTEELHPDLAAAGFRHVPSSLAALNASIVEGHGPAFPSPYPTPTYPPAANVEQPQYGATSEGGGSEQAYQAAGMPMFSSRGSISGEGGVQLSTFSSYPLISRLPPPVLSSLHPPQDFFHPRIDPVVLPSPTYSTDDDRPAPLSYEQPHGPFIQTASLPPQHQPRPMNASSSSYSQQQYNNPHALSTFNPSSAQPHAFHSCPHPYPQPPSHTHPHADHLLFQALDEAAPSRPPQSMSYPSQQHPSMSTYPPSASSHTSYTSYHSHDYSHSAYDQRYSAPGPSSAQVGELYQPSVQHCSSRSASCGQRLSAIYFPSSSLASRSVAYSTTCTPFPSHLSSHYAPPSAAASFCYPMKNAVADPSYPSAHGLPHHLASGDVGHEPHLLAETGSSSTAYVVPASLSHFQDTGKDKGRRSEASGLTAGFENESRSQAPTKGRRQAENESIRKYVCAECDHRFARPSALATHILAHTKEKRASLSSPLDLS